MVGTGDTPTLRYEFRAWGDLDAVAEELGSQRPLDEKDDRDRYVLGPSPGANAKIRQGRLDVKLLVDERDGFQQWRPAIQEEPPFPEDSVGRALAELGVADIAERPRDEAGFEGLAETVDDLATVLVSKHRQHFELGDCIGEVATLTVVESGEELFSVAIEGVDLDALTRLRAELGLDAEENVPMNVAIARTL